MPDLSHCPFWSIHYMCVHVHSMIVWLYINGSECKHSAIGVGASFSICAMIVKENRHIVQQSRIPGRNAISFYTFLLWLQGNCFIRHPVLLNTHICRNFLKSLANMFLMYTNSHFAINLWDQSQIRTLSLPSQLGILVRTPNYNHSPKY
jgi:hypothetical protein